MVMSHDRWEQLADEQRGGKPERAFWAPLARLVDYRQERLEAGLEPYYPPLRLTLREDSGFILASPEGGGTGFARPKIPITRDEAYLAGAFGREGVEKCLDMTVAVARRAGASLDWIANNVEIPALELINAEIPERSPGRPAGSLEPEAVRKRIPRRIARGEEALREYFGEGWPGVLIQGIERTAPPPWEEAVSDKEESND